MLLYTLLCLNCITESSEILHTKSFHQTSKLVNENSLHFSVNVCLVLYFYFSLNSKNDLMILFSFISLLLDCFFYFSTQISHSSRKMTGCIQFISFIILSFEDSGGSLLGRKVNNHLGANGMGSNIGTIGTNEHIYR